MVFVVNHPIRVDALQILSEGEASAAQIARKIGQDMKQVGHHVKVLADHGCIELVRVEQNRGAEEHFYVASLRPCIGDEEWGIAYNRRYVWWKEGYRHPSCYKSTHGWTATLTFCNWVGKNHQPNYGGYHITARAVWDMAPFGGPIEKEEPVSVYAYPSGYANGHNTFCVCNPST